MGYSFPPLDDSSSRKYSFILSFAISFQAAPFLFGFFFFLYLKHDKKAKENKGESWKINLQQSGLAKEMSKLLSFVGFVHLLS